MKKLLSLFTLFAASISLLLGQGMLKSINNETHPAGGGSLGAFVQAVFCHGSSPSTCGGSDWGSNVTAGHNIILVGTCNNGCTISVADNNSNSYTTNTACTVTGFTGLATMWVAEAANVTGGAKPTITITGSSVSEIYALDYSGLANPSYDKSACQMSNTTSGNTATTSFANETVIGFGASDTSVATGSGFTSRYTGGFNYAGRIEDKNVTSTGAQAALFTGAGSTAILVATFKSQ